MPGAFLTARDAAADEQQAALLEFLRAPDGVREVGVATVDDHVALLEVGNELADCVVNCVAGAHHEHDLARAREAPDERLDRLVSRHVGAGGGAGHELLRLGGSAVEDRDAVAVLVHVQDEVLSHHGKADQADVGLLGRVHAPSLSIGIE